MSNQSPFGFDCYLIWTRKRTHHLIWLSFNAYSFPFLYSTQSIWHTTEKNQILIQINLFVSVIHLEYGRIQWNKISLMVIKAGVRTHINQWNKLHGILHILSELYQWFFVCDKLWVFKCQFHIEKTFSHYL